ncbi:putative Vacuolar protein sorting-associated protein 4A [Blattamonas nauphoetae]|uniref:Vacuolar protein sorting-associated protein 4A n=1 Tax=Blattamonas nauphoetae TaxID=2049346 RepID=A0ABQ9YHE6_9EUKA|nr:putative Vacuolar protein sorting-associated protein 4A [Blattamonas nauphoetae]
MDFKSLLQVACTTAESAESALKRKSYTEAYSLYLTAASTFEDVLKHPDCIRHQVSPPKLPRSNSAQPMKKTVPSHRQRDGASLTISGSLKSFVDSIKNPEKKQRYQQMLASCDPQIIQNIEREIVWDSTNISWDDIIGLQPLKELLNEVVVYPLIRPDIFTDLRAPPKGILLFGPPGTGKTLVAKALANQAKTRFFSISASSLTSKWVGESEKTVKALFTVARIVQPSIIFIDEIDSLLSSRGSTENEGSRRLKTEFLVEMDGVQSGSDDQVIVIGATNRPFDLDDAILRRMPRRVYLPLPSLQDREKLLSFRLSTVHHNLSPSQITKVAQQTELFSNADISQLCGDAAFWPIRRIDKQELVSIDERHIPPVTYQDVLESLKRVRPSVGQSQLSQFKTWNTQFGMLF